MDPLLVLITSCLGELEEKKVSNSQHVISKDVEYFLDKNPNVPVIVARISVSILLMLASNSKNFLLLECQFP